MSTIALPIRDDDPVVRFVKRECYRVPGALMPFSEFRERFAAWSAEREAPYRGLDQIKTILKALGLPVGRGNFNKVCIGNLTFEKGVKRGSPVTQYAHRLLVPRKPAAQRSPEQKRLAQARRTITTMGRQGYRLRFIADHLNARGFIDEAGNDWNAATVNRELRR